MKFPKAYEPNQYEPHIYALWEKSRSFSRSKHKGKQPFTIVMPPPNANGNLHIGHGLTIALEDILTRFYRMQGQDAWYIPGADHAGFETWVVYERQLEAAGKSRFDFSRDAIYQQVYDFVQKQRGNMELQIRALGASCDWDSLTFTLDDKVVQSVYQSFHKMWQDGLIYRGKKLVNYCTKHQTAFADIEVEHQEEQGTLWSIAYPLTHPSTKIKEIVISTTRPETMLGDTAVAVNPDDPRYQSLIGQTVNLPLTNRQIPIIADPHADANFGTGAVKITPAHDPNDYEVGLRHHLEQISVIGFDDKMTSAAGLNYAGLSSQQARQKILQDLERLDLRRGEQKIIHSVGHCYKCGNIIQPLLKEQWFIDVKPLAKRAIKALEQGQIQFYPENKRNVLINYLKQLKDWNISRQIPWGIPIPAFQNIADPYDWIFDTRVNMPSIEKDGKTYRRDEDTLDTWFSSGQWPIILTSDNPEHYPNTVMETGVDLLFPWISRMIMLGLYIKGDVPFKTVYLHGMVLDENSQKMSKSKGNVINPIETISKYGSDALRLGLVSSRSAGVNQAFSLSKVQASRNLCNKLWNISRFIQSAVDQQDLVHKAPTAPMGEDWIKRELWQASLEVDQLIQNYRFAEAADYLYNLIWNKYADWFIEVEKLWKNIPLLQTSLEYILKLLHPFAPFVTETIWQNLSWTEGILATQSWPKELKYDPQKADDFAGLINIISSIRSRLAALKTSNTPTILFNDDELIDQNQILVQFLTKAPAVLASTAPTGLRLALPGHNVYLDFDQKTLQNCKARLEQDILALGKEIETLSRRLNNPNYRNKAPANLVAESETHLEQKSTELQKLKTEFNGLP